MRVLVLFIALLAACREAPPPDVIFITIDTLRVDHVGAFASDSPAHTPRMNRLAERGTLYRQAYSPISVTGPAFVTLHTGRDPDRHGVRMNGFRGGTQILGEVELLAERLQSSGYRTGAFVSGFTLREGLGLERGFEVYSAPEESAGGNGNRRDGAETVELAIDWLEEEEGPSFLWFHTYDAHGPLDRWTEVPEDEDWERSALRQVRIPDYQHLGLEGSVPITSPEFYIRRYALAVEYVDLQVGRILDSLEEAGRLDDALVVLTADHGESLTERELWFDHGTHATEEQLHVPLIIQFPGGERQGSDADELVGLMDIAPTVVDVLGQEPLAGTDGWSLRAPGVGHSVLMGESSHCKGRQESILDCEPHGMGGKEFAARNSSLTVIHEASTDWTSILLYDRVADPHELVPMENEEAPEGMVRRLRGMRAVLDELVEEQQPIRRSRVLTREERLEQQMLESLGYTE